MKIVVVDTTIGKNLIGGAQTFLAKLLYGFVREGNEVHLVTEGLPNEKVKHQIEESKAILHTSLWDLADLVEDTAPILANWLNKLKPDVYVISVSPDIGWAVLPLLDPMIATVAITHSDQNTFYKPITHYSDHLTKVVGVSQDICNKLEIVSGLNKSKINLIPYGVEIRSSPIEENTDNAIQLIYVGRLEDADKRSNDVIGIIKGLKRSEFNYKFRIIGDGSLKSKFAKNLETEIDYGAVELLGWLESKQVLFYLRQSDIFVLTSESEGFCIAMIEAAGNGCCLLVTDIPGGNQQLVENGKNGFLIPVGDIENFVERIKSLSTDRQTLLTLRENAFQAGKDFSIQKMVKAYLHCFEESIADAKEEPRQSNPSFSLMASCRSKYPLWLRRIRAKTKNYISAS